MSWLAVQRQVRVSVCCHQVELQKAPTAAGASSTAKGSSRVASPASDAHPSGLQLPTFVQLLEDSLVASRSNRGWYDTERQYQQLQQSNVPLKLPKVTALPPPHTPLSSTSSTSRDICKVGRHLHSFFGCKTSFDPSFSCISSVTPDCQVASCCVTRS